MWYDPWIDQRGSEVLGRAECLRLLSTRSGSVGRLGLVVEQQPVIIPLNYAMGDGDVLVRIGPGTALSSVREGQTIVAFEVDDAVAGEGSPWWSVLVQGLASPLAQWQPAGGGSLAPAPAVPNPGSTVVRIRTETVTGRRFAGPAVSGG